MTRAAWIKATKDLPTKSAKIRALDALGVPRAEIARFLDIRYQHVRNVVTAERPALARHVAEAPAPYEPNSERAHAQDDGAIRIPPALAKQLGAAPGESLVAIPQDGGLWIATPKVSRAHAQAMIRAALPANAGSVDDFIAWRRQEAADLERDFAEHDKFNQ